MITQADVECQSQGDLIVVSIVGTDLIQPIKSIPSKQNQFQSNDEEESDLNHALIISIPLMNSDPIVRPSSDSAYSENDLSISRFLSNEQLPNNF